MKVCGYLIKFDKMNTMNGLVDRVFELFFPAAKPYRFF